jgi:hypothetical protein
MTTEKPLPAAQLQQLMEQAKTIRSLPQATRARVLKRAHLSTLLGATLAPSMAAPRRAVSSPFAWLGGAGVAIALAGAAIALHGRPFRASEGAPMAASAAAVCARVEAGPSVSVTEVTPPLVPVTSTAEVAREPRPAPVVESYAAELELLQRAHAVFGTRDFATTLRLLTEHGRRFPNGRLAEEREALRVRALSSSGHGESARLAASAFALRFPRSVFLARTMAAVDAGGAKPR